MQRCIHHGIDDVQPLVIAQIVRFFFRKEGDSFFVSISGCFFWRDFLLRKELTLGRWKVEGNRKHNLRHRTAERRSIFDMGARGHEGAAEVRSFTGIT